MNDSSQTVLNSKTKYQCILLTLTVFMLVPHSQSRGSTPAAEKVGSSRADIPLETTRFVSTGDAVQDDTPGALGAAGYLWRDVTVIRRTYRAVERKIGGATVETINHSPDYPYVLHDFFGVYGIYWTGKSANARSQSRSVEQGEIIQRFVNWTIGDTGSSGMICVIVVPKKDGVFGGNIGWYNRANDKLSTVVIYFDQLDGVPVQVIDEFLQKYPSSVKEEDLDAAGWVGNDVHKWIHLLQLHKGDRPMFQQALGRLARYDRGLFGIDPKRLDVDDPAMFDKAIEDVKEGAERWLQDREAKKGQERDD